MLGKIISAAFVFGIKLFSKTFYRTRAHWLTPVDKIHWEDLKLAVLLNHTSLFEPLFISAIPNYRLWRAIERVVVPVADVTMNRPLAGRFFKTLVPNAMAITRKRDDSWSQFMDKVGGNSLIVIFPEGRMKRKDGLDKHGNPMTVKGGVVDILNKIEQGKILIVVSGGLHHVQAPGDWFPKLFQSIDISFEEVDVAEYKAKLKGSNFDEFRANVIGDLQKRLESGAKL
jgi:hypothetical protein